MTREMATRTQNPQQEIIRDTQDESKLPNRPPTSLPPADAEQSILSGNTPQPSPFVSSTTGTNIDDAHRIRRRMVEPQTPLNAFLEQISQHETPIMHQPPPSINIEVGPSGTDPTGEVDYDSTDAEVAKDTQYLGDYQDTLNKSRRQSNHMSGIDDFFRHAQEVGASPNDFLRPTSTEKAGFPVAHSRFVSPEPPEAFAQPAITQAHGQKVDGRIDKDLQQAGFRNAPEVFLAIQKWNNTHGPDDQIVAKSKTIAVMKEGLAKNKNVKTLKALKEFDNTAPIQLTHIPMPRKVKQSVNLSDSSMPIKLQGARFKNIITESSGATDL